MLFRSAVSEASFASKCLLQKDEQAKVREQFKELFGFTGVLMVRPKVEGSEANKAPENLLSARGREADAKRDQMAEEARNAPFTRDLLQALGGTLENVKVP